MKDGDAFSRLMEEFGSLEKTDNKEEEKDKKGKEANVDKLDKPGEKGPQTALMQAEERNRGAVPLNVYADYLRHAGGLSWGPLILVLLILTQASSGEFACGCLTLITLTRWEVANNLFLGYWSGQTIHGFTNSEYMVCCRLHSVIA